MSLADDVYDLGLKVEEAKTALGEQIDFDIVDKGNGVYHSFIYIKGFVFEFADVAGSIAKLDTFMGDPTAETEYNKQLHIAALQAQINALGG
jgi:hypothetical protein